MCSARNKRGASQGFAYVTMANDRSMLKVDTPHPLIGEIGRGGIVWILFCVCHKKYDPLLIIGAVKTNTYLFIPLLSGVRVRQAAVGQAAGAGAATGAFPITRRGEQ